MATERILSMNSGVGETSYAKNSLLQKKLIKQVKPILKKSVKEMVFKKSIETCWNVVDLGCSSGPNSLMVMLDIMKIIDSTCLSLNRGPQVFQIYLNDLPSNDFNTMFKLLPDFYQSLQQERGNKAGPCFINASPGTFYGRLFPNNYIHVFNCSSGLNWLSQAPKDLSRKEEPLNKGNIYITRTSPPSVYEAYNEQFERDFKKFIKARSEELTPGGTLVLHFLGREKDNEMNCPWLAIGMVLNDMVQEGLVDEETLDSFELPIYSPTMEEVRHVIEEEGSLTINTLKTFQMGWDANLQEEVSDHVLDSNVKGEFVAMYLRAAFEPILLVGFGEDIMDELFSRVEKLVAQLYELGTIECTSVVASMSKDSHE